VDELGQCENNIVLMIKFTIKDVEQALEIVKNGKASGADGIILVFFKNVWTKEDHDFLSYRLK